MTCTFAGGISIKITVEILNISYHENEASSCMYPVMEKQLLFYVCVCVSCMELSPCSVFVIKKKHFDKALEKKCRVDEVSLCLLEQGSNLTKLQSICVCACSFEGCFVLRAILRRSIVSCGSQIKSHEHFGTG